MFNFNFNKMKIYYLVSLDSLRLVSTTKAENQKEAEVIFMKRNDNIYEHIITDCIEQKQPFRNIYN